AEKAFQESLTDTRPRWRMLGRSEIIPHKDECLQLLVYPNYDGHGFGWHLLWESDDLATGREETALRASLMGGRALEVEMYKREFVEPEDFTAVAKASAEADESWGLTELIKWAIQRVT